jgi:hypothetical protein
MSDIQSSYSSGFLTLTLRWTPRAIAGCLAGYYSLGIAYEKGWMAALDRIAIQILSHHTGYLGIGAIMPTFQWYSALSVRLLSGLLGALVYDLAERASCAVYRIWVCPNQQP